MAALLFVGCGGAGEVSLQTDRDTYRLGDTALVRFENVDAHLMEFGRSCDLTLEGGASENLWTPMAVQPGCPASGNALRAGESFWHEYPLGDQLVPGRYRFTLRADVTRRWNSQPEAVTLHSDPFFVFAE